MTHRNIPAQSVLFIVSVSVLVVAALSLPVGADAGGKPYVLAVVPSAPPVATYAAWTPFAEALSRETKLVFTVKVYERMLDFENDIEGGGPDFIFASPTQMVLARLTRGYVPLVRSSSFLSAVVFVRRDSPYQTAADLAGKEIAFVGKKNL